MFGAAVVVFRVGADYVAALASRLVAVIPRKVARRLPNQANCPSLPPVPWTLALLSETTRLHANICLRHFSRSLFCVARLILDYQVSEWLQVNEKKKTLMRNDLLRKFADSFFFCYEFQVTLERHVGKACRR